MKRIFFKSIFLMFMMVFLNCIGGVSEPIQKDKIKDAVIKFKKTTKFTIKFSNLIYKVDGKEIKIPIFKGNMGDVYYDEFMNFCYDNKLLDKKFCESGFIVEAKKGEVKKTFHEFLRFYQNNLFKDIGIDVNRPIEISDAEPAILFIYYDFKIKDIPMVLKITIYTTDTTGSTRIDKKKSVFDIDIIDENFETPPPFFYFGIYENATHEDC